MDRILVDLLGLTPYYRLALFRGYTKFMIKFQVAIVHSLQIYIWVHKYPKLNYKLKILAPNIKCSLTILINWDMAISKIVVNFFSSSTQDSNLVGLILVLKLTCDPIDISN